MAKPVDDVLAHFGILGMKWGVRRYQNKDGSLTPAGKKHAEKEEKRKEIIDKMTSPTVKVGKDKSNISPAEKITKETGRILDETGNILDSSARLKNMGKESPAKKMTDKELRDYVNRLELERRYESLTTQEVFKGAAYTKEILSVSGSVVGIAGGLLSIASVAKALKG